MNNIHTTCNCIDCGEIFEVSAEERNWYESKGWTIPKRCKACRDERKTKKQEKAAATKAKKKTDKAAE